MLKSNTTEDVEPYAMSTRTIIMLKLSVGCLALKVVQLYWALENNIIQRHVEDNYKGRHGTVCDEY